MKLIFEIEVFSNSLIQNGDKLETSREMDKMNVVSDNNLKKVEKFANEYYNHLQKDSSYKDGFFKFHQKSAIKNDFDLIFSEIPKIIETNKKLSECNKKLLERCSQLEKSPKEDEDSKLKLRIDNLTNRLIDVENQIKQVESYIYRGRF